ncbi:hypothetical protein NVP1081O_076 [Vibrio phage 1.081.O._10N.286.52.C2]|nr:hypothetical protein NVP1081O_076 [Vibrio phage 1.081.O._10N.286.52.C2]
MTHDFNMILEQYNLANHDCDGDFDDYYWAVAEWISQTVFNREAIRKHDILELLCDLLEIDEHVINVDDVDSLLIDIYAYNE